MTQGWVIEEATYPDILLVAATMRQSDWNEIFALRDKECIETISTIADRMSPAKWVYRDESGAAVAVWGVLRLWGDVYSVWMWANDLFGEAPGRRMVAHFRRWMRKNPLNIRRLECKSTVDHIDAHRFIKAAGLTQEGPPIVGYGKNGEDFVPFAWVADFSRVEC